MQHPPRRIETPRLVLRVCQPAEAHLLRAAIDSSLAHLRVWLPWAMQEPRSLPETRDFLSRALERFARGEDFQYMLFDREETRVIGAAGLHRRGGASALEIGYWVRADSLRQGFATEAARALTDLALQLPGVERVRIACDPRNTASKGVPMKLGYTLRELLRDSKVTPAGDAGETLVFEMVRAGV